MINANEELIEYVTKYKIKFCEVNDSGLGDIDLRVPKSFPDLLAHLIEKDLNTKIYMAHVRVLNNLSWFDIIKIIITRKRITVLLP